MQVKSSGRLYARGYEVQPVYSVPGKGKVELTAEDIDVLAAYVRGRDVWYVLPVEAFSPAKSLRFYPDVECKGAEWEVPAELSRPSLPAATTTTIPAFQAASTAWHNGSCR